MTIYWCAMDERVCVRMCAFVRVYLCMCTKQTESNQTKPNQIEERSIASKELMSQHAIESTKIYR